MRKNTTTLSTSLGSTSYTIRSSEFRRDGSLYGPIHQGLSPSCTLNSLIDVGLIISPDRKTSKSPVCSLACGESSVVSQTGLIGALPALTPARTSYELSVENSTSSPKTVDEEVDRIQSTANEVARHSRDIHETAEEQTRTIDDIADEVNNLAEESQEQASRIEEMVDEAVSEAESIVSRTVEQKRMVEAVEELAGR
jgi:gas vesicle protein